MTRRTRTRRGTTLVELMVAAAMSIMVMWLLTWCYQQGLASFSNTKAHGDLMDQERMVTSVMTRDLKADHFLEEDGKPNRGRRVRDQRLDQGGYTPPRSGFFWAKSPLNSGFDEGIDGDSFQSTRSTSHALQLTVILPGGPPENMFNADVPIYGAPLYGRAAEVTYFLSPSGRSPGGYQLYNLIRRQRLCALTTDDAPAYNQKLKDLAVQPADATEVMAVTNASPPTILTLGNLTVPANRLPQPFVPIGTTYRLGEDILMSNVTSLEIKFAGSGFTTVTPSNPTGTWPEAFPGNSDYPYGNLPANGQFDTGSPNTSAKVRITGAMIRLRAYESRTRITRQTTFVVDL